MINYVGLLHSSGCESDMVPLSRETSPFAPAVITLGKIAGGAAFNVIADTVEIEGTVRALEQSERERLLRRIDEIASGVAAWMGA